MGFTVEYMQEVAKDILDKNPEYYLCGSLALVLSGLIPTREIGDLDFVVRKEDFRIKKLRLENSNYGASDFDGYTCYKTTGDVNGFYYNVFVHDDSSKVKTGTMKSNNFRCQLPSQIIQWKKEFARRKDKEDLKNLISKGDVTPFDRKPTKFLY